MENNENNNGGMDSGFVDTSSPEFWNNLGEDEDEESSSGAPSIAMQDLKIFNDMIPGAEKGAEDEEGEEKDPSGENPTGENDKSNTGNQYLDDYLDFAKSKGIEVDPKSFDKDKFGEEDWEKSIGKFYASKYYSGVDPKITMLAEQGVNIDEYINHRQNIQQMIQADDSMLYKRYVYNALLEQESKLGTVVLGEDGSLTEKQQQYLLSEVEKRVGQLDENQVKAYGQQIKEGYKSQLEQLPEAMIQQQQQQQLQYINNWNKGVEKNVEEFKKVLDKEDSLVVPFSGQAEKDDFTKYVKEQLSYNPSEPTKGTPFFSRLQEDPEFLNSMLRLAHMVDNGFFTDIKNMERNAAFRKMSASPLMKGQPKENGAGNNRFEDTSSPAFWKKYNK